MFAKVNEDKLTPEFMTKKVIKALTYSGCRLGKRAWWEKIIGGYFSNYCAMIVFLHCLNFAFGSNYSMGNFIEEMTLLVGFAQVTTKFYIAIAKSKLIISMLNTLWNDFWSINRLDEEHKKSTIFLYILGKRISEIYKYAIIFASLAFILRAFLKMDKSLINEVSIPHAEILKISPYYEITFTVQAIMFMSVVCACLIPIDQLFILLIFCVCVQFQIIREEMKLLNKLDNPEKKSIIKTIVKHHNRLIRFLETFENVYSKPLLIIIATDYVAITMTMYGITYEESINQKLSYFSVYLAMMGQILAYCVAGQLIHDQVYEISFIIGEAAYNIEWHAISDLQIRKDLTIIILRSQHEIQLTAGGIMFLNMESFLKIVKTTFSLLTFLFNVREADV